MVATAAGGGGMCCSSTAVKSPVAEFLKSQTAQALWKASLKPKDPLKPESPAEVAGLTPTTTAAKTPGTGLLIDKTA